MRRKPLLWIYFIAVSLSLFSCDKPSHAERFYESKLNEAIFLDEETRTEKIDSIENVYERVYAYNNYNDSDRLYSSILVDYSSARLTYELGLRNMGPIPFFELCHDEEGKILVEGIPAMEDSLRESDIIAFGEYFYSTFAPNNLLSSSLLPFISRESEGLPVLEGASKNLLAAFGESIAYSNFNSYDFASALTLDSYDEKGNINIKLKEGGLYEQSQVGFDAMTIRYSNYLLKTLSYSYSLGDTHRYYHCTFEYNISL